MNALARFEGFMQGLMDRRVVRLLGGTLQPVELAHAMARSMEAQRSGTEAPNHFRLLLHPEDYADLRVVDAELERKLALYAVELARERGLNFPAAPEVALSADRSVERGAVQVEATTLRPAPSAAPDSPWRRPSKVGTRAAEAPVYFEVPGGPSPLPLDHFPFAIGRREGKDLILPDPRVSRDHAVVEQVDGRYRLRDLGSRNGTLINGQAVSEADLSDGDRLTMGGFEVTVRIAP